MQPKQNLIGVTARYFGNPVELAAHLREEVDRDKDYYRRMARLGIVLNSMDPAKSQILLEVADQPMRASDKATMLQAPTNQQAAFATAIQCTADGKQLIAADSADFIRYPLIAQLTAAVLKAFEGVTNNVFFAPGVCDISHNWVESATGGFLTLSELIDAVAVPAAYGGGIVAHGITGNRARQLLHLSARKLASGEVAPGNWQAIAEFGSNQIVGIGKRFRDQWLYVSTKDGGIEALDCTELAVGRVKRTGTIDRRNAGFDKVGDIDTETAVFTCRGESGKLNTIIAPVDTRGLPSVNLSDALLPATA